MTTVAGVKPSQRRRYTNGLNTDPGWRCARVARLKLFRKKSNPPVSATTAPSNGSIDANAPCTSGICASRQPPSAVRRKSHDVSGMQHDSDRGWLLPTRSSCTNGAAQLDGREVDCLHAVRREEHTRLDVVGREHDRGLVIEQYRMVVEQCAQRSGIELCRGQRRTGARRPAARRSRAGRGNRVARRRPSTYRESHDSRRVAGGCRPWS